MFVDRWREIIFYRDLVLHSFIELFRLFNSVFYFLRVFDGVLD